MSLATIYINSGTANHLQCTQYSTQVIQIQNSDQSYYKSAYIKFINIDPNDISKITVNSKLSIYINDTIEFDGYVARTRRLPAGKLIYETQCIGRTYDLWRFLIPADTIFSEKYSGYIVSSLVANYCSGNGIIVNPPDIPPTEGSYIESIDVSNYSVGDAIARISKFDGYRFFVDETGTLQYFNVSSQSQFTIQSSDIISMTPLEFADENIKNDVLVIGSQQFERIEPSTEPPYQSGQWITISSQNRFVAQRFQVPSLHRNRLTGLTVRVRRSVGANTPSYLAGEVRKDNAGTPSSAVVADSDSIVWDGIQIQDVASGSWLPYYIYPDHLYLDEGDIYWAIFHYPGATSDIFWKISYSNLADYYDELSSNPSLQGTWDYNSTDYGDITYDSVNDRINFFAKCRGYPAANTFDDNISIRERYFALPSSMFSDSLEFAVSANILSYTSGAGIGDYKKTDDDRYRPRFMIGLCDRTSSAKPMFGFEFDM